MEKEKITALKEIHNELHFIAGLLIAILMLLFALGLIIGIK